VGDHILAINGEPLAGDSPAADLVARAQGPELPAGPATFTIERAGERVEVVLELPPPPTAGLLAGAFRVTLLRNAALLMLLDIFLWRDGQALDHLVLERERFWTETRFGLPALLFLVLGHFVVSVAVSIVGWALGGEVIEAEIGQRMAVTDALLAQLAWTAGIVLLGSATEEVIFRGFLLPRLRHATGSWVAAVAISVVAFGTAHLYEGALATVQTAAIGLMLSLVFLLRRHLMPCIVAHLGFNTLVLGLAYAFVRLGLFEWMQKILGS
jgi:membrane protease YdiL (CAAX protease family)